MRLLFFALALAPTLGFAADWTPPENPDPTAIINEARADRLRGDYQVALAKHLWYHENALKLKPSLSGVRLSFALAGWLELGEDFPPALEKMRELRDGLEQEIRDQDRVRVKFAQFHEFVAFNRTLRQEERTAELFQWLAEDDPEDAKRVFNVSQPALIKQKEYELCGKFLQVDEDVKRIADKYTQGLPLIDRFGKAYADYLERDLINDSATLVALLVCNDRGDEANQAAEKLKKAVVDPKLAEKLNEALESALQGVVPTPWP